MVNFWIRTRLERHNFCPSRLAVAQRPVGKVAELYGGGHWEYLTEDLFPAEAGQPLNSNPRALKKIRRCYPLTRTDCRPTAPPNPFAGEYDSAPCIFLRIHLSDFFVGTLQHT